MIAEEGFIVEGLYDDGQEGSIKIYRVLYGKPLYSFLCFLLRPDPGLLVIQVKDRGTKGFPIVSPPFLYDVI
ncbi:MAG: hypothetical protein N2596_01680 [Syntrophorhabdaceae bacterium]|nr:hypothetical protein [Syntrophorhabdaceae bacterium]